MVLNYEIFKPLLVLRSSVVQEVNKEVYDLKEAYGKGNFTVYSFKDYCLSIADFTFKKDFTLTGTSKVPKLELSFLLEGEKIIDLNYPVALKLANEGPECYMVALDKVKGSFNFRSNKPYREVKIIVYNHALQEYGIYEEVKLSELTDFKFKPLNNEILEILQLIIDHNFSGVTQLFFLKAKILELLANVMEVEVQQTTRNTKLLKKIFQAEQLIKTQPDQHITISEMSKILGINEQLLKKEFKQVFGKPIFEYTQEFKMKRATSLLLTTNLPIYAIAEQIGYKNATHFSAAFKKLQGKTPKLFRKEHQVN